MRFSQTVVSNYVKANDLPDGSFVPVVIERWEMKNVAGKDQPEQNKAVLHFQDKAKGLVLNQINGQTIAEAYGDEMDEWIGRKILLFSTTTLYQGKTTPCVRVKVPKLAPPQVAKPKPAPVTPPVEYVEEAPTIEEDSIPF